MNKVQSQNEAFFTRSGSFATHSSRTGVNLLGWGEDEVLTDEQRRAALVAALGPITNALRDLNEQLKVNFPCREAYEKKALQEELREKNRYINTELSVINARIKRYPKGDDLGDFIIKVAQSKMTKPQWALVLGEARRLFEESAANSIKEVA